MRLAAVSDIHCQAGDEGRWSARLGAANEQADCLLLAGDLTLAGDLAELRVLLGELERITIPIIAVLGNHDYDGGRARVLAETLRRAGIHLLEGSSVQVGGVAFVGGMGVEGGFARGPRRRWSYAEQQFMARLKHYLEAAASMPRVVVLHYAPISATLAGEDADLWPLLGSSAMETAVDAAGADLIIHGHAHHGALEGRTAGGVPVFNVSLPVLEGGGSATSYRLFTI